MIDIQEALRRFNPAEVREHLESAERERAEIQRRFPLENWSEMPIEEYALGQNLPNEEIYSWWLEFGSSHLGSIRGGTSSKHLVYKKKDGSGWSYNENNYVSEIAAWDEIRSGFIEMFRLAQAGQWNEIDSIESISNGRAIRLKTLHVYFPDQILSIGSVYHILHFLNALGVDTKGIQHWQAVKLNRMLLETLREFPELEGWTTNQIERFLYSWNDPREEEARAPQLIKIAPGEEGRYWQDCLKNGYIRVGWGNVGDLREYETEAEFQAAFEAAYRDTYNGHQPTIRKKAEEVWTLRGIQPGDKIIANRGVSAVLGIGTVVEPGYDWLPDVEEYNHAVRVEWDITHAGEKNLPSAWRFVTVAPVSQELYQRIVGTEDEKLIPVPTSPLFTPIADALERKGQVILHGPPGTGKTYHALRFAEWWLARENGQKVTSQNTRQTPRRVWWVVANPKQWAWEKLSQGDTVDYHYGRLKRNYSLVQTGDLVVGYMAAPEKKVVALARVTEGLHGDSSEPRITLELLHRIKDGLTFGQLIEDATLRHSEPARFRCQGTLFKLEQDEAEYLFSLLAERDPKLEEYLEQCDSSADTDNQLTIVTFHPSYSYEDFIEGFRPQDSGDGLRLRLADGVFKTVCTTALANPNRKYLIIVDEINRANLAKVFGEIITLLERDKRDVKVVLPQSKEPFRVPANVYMLGTMNTSDRSIHLMDAALRRRFSFIEIMPDMALLRGAQIEGGLDLYDYLNMLNARISRNQGREKQIGHAFFIKDGQAISDTAEFAQRFRQEVLPLLQEYCYDDYMQLSEYVGVKLVNTDTATLREDVLYDDSSLVAALAEFTASELRSV